MESPNPRTPPAKQRADTTSSKRKHCHVNRLFRHHRIHKRRRIVSATEISSLEPDPTVPGPSSDDLRPTQPSTHQRLKKHRRVKSPRRSDDRKWVSSRRDFSNYKDKVIFITYNILGVENASKHPDLYSNVPSRVLDWDYRKKLLHREINRYNPSIMCLQEVDNFNDLDDLLQKDGFSGVFLARTGEACDGCAIFWKNELFTLSHEENIEFQRFGLRNNVAQLCVFKMKQSRTDFSADCEGFQAPHSQSLIVGNIHVLFNPNRGDIKLGQMRLFLEKAHKLSREWGNIPVVVAGDFNSVPQSAMYQYLESAELDIRLHDRRNVSGNTCPSENQAFRYQNNRAARFWGSVSRPVFYRWTDEELRLANGAKGGTRLRHDLKLYSAYTGVPGSRRTRDRCGEPLVTSYHSKFMGTVDYIWHTEELAPVKVLETLPIDILRQTGGLPSERWGSDHLALVCEFAFISDDGNSICSSQENPLLISSST